MEIYYPGNVGQNGIVCGWKLQFSCSFRFVLQTFSLKWIDGYKRVCAYVNVHGLFILLLFLCVLFPI